nr:integrase, catalytic region, zinc finger, CCHC-type, peptidase aspartic, catalytic [Tanacetum cinerariifolium]
MLEETIDVLMFKRKLLRDLMRLAMFKGLFGIHLREILQLFNATTIDEPGVILTDEQNDFLSADALRMEEIEDLSANICLMAIIQPTNHSSDVGPSYDSAFVSEVQSSSINENEEQMYPSHTKIINSTISDDQIDNNIIFDTPNRNVSSGSVEKDTHVPDLWNSLQGMFMLGPKPLSVYDQQLKHEIMRTNEDTLDDASKSQQKVKEKMNDPIDVANKQNCWTVYYQQINALYKDFVHQKELSAEQKYFPSSFIHSDMNSNAAASILTSMPSESPLIIELDKMRSCFQKLSELIQKNCKRAKMNAASSVRRSMNIDSHDKNDILANSRNSTKKVVVYVRKNKQTDNTFMNVISNKKNVIDVDVANAYKAKNLLSVSCMQNVLIPCHDKCLAHHRLNASRTLTTKSRTPKSSDTTYVVLKTRFFEKPGQSKTLDTTFVGSKSKIDVCSTSEAKNKVVHIVLWIIDSGCSKHMMGDRSLLRNFIKKFMGTVRFGNDNFAAITGYGDYIQGNITICHVYYVEGRGHNLFSVGQFCDGDLEVAFRSKTCYVQNLEGDDLLTGGRESNLYTISISEMAASSPV